LHLILKHQQAIPQESADFKRPFAVSSIITSGQHQEVKDLFIEAARQSPNDPDADVSAV